MSSGGWPSDVLKPHHEASSSGSWGIWVWLGVALWIAGVVYAVRHPSSPWKRDYRLEEEMKKSPQHGAEVQHQFGHA